MHLRARDRGRQERRGQWQAAMAWAAKSAWGGGASNAAERARLPKGNEDCFLCAGDAVEVKLRPCDHAICLECANKMRQTNIFKVGDERR